MRNGKKIGGGETRTVSPRNVTVPISSLSLFFLSAFEQENVILPIALFSHARQRRSGEIRKGPRVPDGDPLATRYQIADFENDQVPCPEPGRLRYQVGVSCAGSDFPGACKDAIESDSLGRNFCLDTKSPDLRVADTSVERYCMSYAQK